MYYFRGYIPNFGDELNATLMPKVFPDLFEGGEDLFLGIGSVIFDNHPVDRNKVVFGSGYGGYTALPVFNETWKIYCVRGPRTAALCGLSPDFVAGDAAILIKKFRPPKLEPAKGFSFMPHWLSVGKGHWQAACDIAGVKFIDPSAPVEEVLQAIESSEAVITEAMHGAIVSDALRVPWIPVLPIQKIHRMKWFDWAEALDLSLEHNRIFPSSTREAFVALRGAGEGHFIQNAHGVAKAGLKVLDWGFVHLAAARLKALTRATPMQSSDAALDRAIERLEESAARIRADYPFG